MTVGSKISKMAAQIKFQSAVLTPWNRMRTVVTTPRLCFGM